MEYKKIQEEEAKTWILDDPTKFRDKKMRETIRYPLLAKQMGLNNLDTSWMTVWDIGAGPFGGVSTVLRCKEVKRIDPLKKEYKKISDVSTYDNIKAENLKFNLKEPDLIICTNSIDHFEFPESFLEDLGKYMKPGAYFAHLHAIDNAVTHPHPAHVHNINPALMRKYLSKDFECVWYSDYATDGLTYGWLKQESFAGLYRKVTGY